MKSARAIYPAGTDGVRLVLWLAAVVIAAVLAAAQGRAATYLPDAGDLPKTLKDIDATVGNDLTITSYVTPPGLKNVQSDVKCPAAGCNFPANTKIGIFDFDYAGYRGTLKVNADSFDFAGAILRGGFILDPGFTPKPDWTPRKTHGVERFAMSPSLCGGRDGGDGWSARVFRHG